MIPLSPMRTIHVSAAMGDSRVWEYEIDEFDDYVIPNSEYYDYFELPKEYR